MVSKVSTAQEIRARKLCMSTILSASDYFEAHPFMYEPLELDGTLLDRLIDKVRFKTQPRLGNGQDQIEFVVGRAVYTAISSMDEYQPYLSVFPKHFVKSGSPIFYKGLPITTDAVLPPGTWMLPPNSIYAISTRRNGSTVITRPCALEVDIPCLDESEVFDPYIPLSKRV